MPRPYPTEVVERVRELRILGGRAAAIAKLLGICESTVHGMIRDLPRVPRSDALSPDIVRQVREAVFCGVPKKDVAALFGLSSAQVIRRTRDMIRWKLPADVVRRIRRLRRAGKGVTHIARETRVSKSAVRRYVQDLPRPVATPTKVIARIRALWADGWSMRDIERDLHMSRKTIRRYVRA